MRWRGREKNIQNHRIQLSYFHGECHFDIDGNEECRIEIKA